MKQSILETLLVIGMIVGFFIALSPHATHIAVDHDYEHRHVKEIVVGLIIGLGSLIYLFYLNRDQLKFIKSSKKKK